MSFQLRIIRHNEYARAVEVMQSAFTEPPGFFDTFMRQDPCFGKDHIIAGFENGKLVSTHIVLPREVWIAGVRLRLGAIANVSTDPSTQGKGYASKMMRFSVEEMRARGYELSALYGLDRFYSRFGWQSIHRRAAICSLAKKDISSSKPRPVRWPQDIHALMQIHQEFVKRKTALQHRTETYWRSWIKTFRVDDCKWTKYWIVDGQDGPNAYLAAKRDEKNGVLKVSEYAFASGCAQAAAKSAAALTASMELEKTVFHTTEPELEEVLPNIFANVESERRPDAMYQLIHPQAFQARTGLDIAGTPELCEYLEANAYMAYLADDF